jgi:predicted alpha/beta-fold hydrolase
MYTAAETGDLTEVVDYLHKKYVLDEHGRKVRAFTGVGISLGASVLALYAARIGSKNPFDAQAGVSCHFDTHSAFQFMSTNLFGFYDYALGLGLLMSN